MILTATHYQENKHKWDSGISNGLGFKNKTTRIIQKNDKELTTIACYTYSQILLIILSDICIFIQTIHFWRSLCWKVLDKPYGTFLIILFWYKVLLNWWKWISNREKSSSLKWQFSESILPNWHCTEIMFDPLSLTFIILPF